MYCVRTVLSHFIKSHSKVTPLRHIYFKNTPVLTKWRLYHFSTVAEDETENMIDDLCKSDPEIEKKLRILMLEVEVMRQDGRRAPDTLEKRHWQHLMELPSRNQRANYLNYLWKTEKSKENQKAKKEAKRKKLEENMPEISKEYPDDQLYGIAHQSLFLRIRDQSVNNFDNYRVLQAMIYGQSVVIDCSYEDKMVMREAVNAAKQMTFLFGDNRLHKEPFNIHMCNVDLEGEFMKQMRRNIPSLEEPWFPINVHTDSYLDVFPKEKLVYLTPHCRNELTCFDHDAVYIVGCMVDKVNNEPLSMAKAKKDGIKMAKLPLDRYLEWGPGAKKNLNINHMIPILLDLKVTGDWEHSLRHIPRRKLMETKIKAMQNRFLKSNPSLRKELFRLKNTDQKTLSFKEKRQKSRSLYDDDNVM